MYQIIELLFFIHFKTVKDMRGTTNNNIKFII